MNEEGLYIWEMSFDTRYPSDENQPVLFQMLWMQYQLDNFRTVEEVIENVSRVSIDGWGWHYFVADRSGKTAVIDFIGGRAVVYTGEDMPVPICCNSVYPDALKWLRQHRGFGGDLAIEKIRQEIPRFVYGAELMRRYGSQDPVKYSFNMLAEMSQNVRWSVVIDVEDLTVHFKTNLNQKVRRFRLTRADFKGDETLMLNIEHPGPEQIRNEFVPCTPDRNRRSIGAFFDLVCEHYPPFRKALLDDQGVTIDQLVTGFQDKIWGSSPPAGRELPGIWIGEIKFPTRDGWKEYPVNLRLSAGNESLSGTVEIVGFMEECPITNVQNRGGLLYFTHKHPQSGEVSQFQLYQTAEGIKGAAESWNRRKKAVVSLSRSEAVGN
jgi:hypothetical protein